jgi:RHS repeat-associated protein
VVSFAYSYNSANQRTSVTNADGSYWTYTYDALGQVTAGKRYWSDGTSVAGHQFEYAFDDIGNRESATRDDRQSDYSANLLNQYESRTVPGYVNILGSATNTATVTVNLQATSRKGDYFRAELQVSNSAPLWLGVTNIAVLQQGTNADVVATNIGHLLIPQTPEAFTHDADGNLTSDSLWTNTWNAENQRTLIESRANVPVGGRAREQWTHLPDGRWIERIVSTNNGSVYIPAFTNRYVWDAQVLLAVLDEAGNVLQSYARGLDLSGSHQGAGGVGGLLWVSAGTNGTHFACFDGNGNVMGLVDASTGEESARYEYAPFSEDIRATGPMARINRLRFSTQYADEVTGERKWCYRDYRADLGRWPNRDPITELGFRVERRGRAVNYGMWRLDLGGAELEPGLAWRERYASSIPERPIM